MSEPHEMEIDETRPEGDKLNVPSEGMPEDVVAPELTEGV